MSVAQPQTILTYRQKYRTPTYDLAEENMQKRLRFNEIDVLYALRELQEFESEDTWVWLTEVAITESVYGRYTATARKRVRIVLRALRKKGLVERRKHYKPISWRLISIWESN